MDSLPSIAVITPSLNQGMYIEETILSFTAQGYAAAVHHVIDGGSRDVTLDILRRYPHLQWISEPDQGQTPAINKGIRMSRSDIVAYLNADDVYRPGALHAVADAFARDPTIAALVGDCDVIDENSQPAGHCRARLEKFEDMLRYWSWGKTFCLPQPSVFLRRTVLDQIGLFDERYDLAMDYEMWLRIAAEFPLTILNRTLAAFRVTRETKTNQQRRKMDLEEFRAGRRYWRAARAPHRWTIPVEASVRRILA